LKNIKREVQEEGGVDFLTGRVASLLFYETSPRTTGSYHSAMIRAGGQVHPVITQFSSPDEAFEDVIRTIQGLSDVIVMHHPDSSYIPRATAVADVPIINCDGAQDLLTEGLLNLMSIQAEVGKIDGLTIAMVGDLKNDLSVRSLCQLLSNFNVHLEFVSPNDLQIDETVTKTLLQKKISFNSTTHLNSVLSSADIIHVAPFTSEQSKDLYDINQKVLKSCKPNVRVLHPYPKHTETDLDVDQDSRVMFFKQPSYGMYINMALLSAVLGAI